jgi:UDP:flavonoid glycosyltransferase YjiC (YdhE family)
VRLLFSFAGGEGHLQPLLPVARSAAATGHTVAVTGAASMRPVAEAAGLAFSPSGPDVVPQRIPLRPIDLEHEHRVVGDHFAGDIARARAADLLALCADRVPDIVVRDEVDFGAAVAAERLGIPHAVVLVIAAGSFVRRSCVVEPLDALRAEHGLGPDPGLAMLSRYLVLSPFPASFRDPLPATGHRFRSSLPPDRAGEPALVERLSDRPIVYVTLGTIFNTESGDLLSRVLAGVGELPVNVVATVGRTLDPAEVAPQPDNVVVERYVPQSTLLPACSAVVTHGGSGSVIGALEHGLPLVCIPLGADQPLNATRCDALGVGRELDAMALTSDDVRAATWEVLTEPGHRRAAMAVAAEIAAQPPPGHAVELLERLAATRRPVIAVAT